MPRLKNVRNVAMYDKLNKVWKSIKKRNFGFSENLKELKPASTS
jgi:hypothetical protein